MKEVKASLLLLDEPLVELDLRACADFAGVLVRFFLPACHLPSALGALIIFMLYLCLGVHLGIVKKPRGCCWAMPWTEL